MQFFETTLGLAFIGSLLTSFGVIIGFAMATVPNLVRQRQVISHSLTSEKRNLAMRTVLALDDFVGGCYLAAHDTPEFNPDGSGEFVFHENDPTLVLPKDVEWRVFGDELAEDIVWLPNRVQNVSDGLETLDMSPTGSDIYFQQRQLELSRLGLRALEIIDRLCDAEGVNRPVRPSYYTPRDGFLRKITEIEKAQRRQSNRQAATPKEGSNVTSIFTGQRASPLPDPTPE
jgi:hypothetical protein